MRARTLEATVQELRNPSTASSRLQTTLTNAREEIEHLSMQLYKEVADSKEALAKAKAEACARVREAAEANRRVDALHAQVQGMKVWHNARGRARSGCHPSANANARFQHRQNLVNDLKEFMDHKFQGHDGPVAQDAIVAYLRANPSTASSVVEALGVKQHLQTEFLLPKCSTEPLLSGELCCSLHAR